MRSVTHPAVLLLYSLCLSLFLGACKGFESAPVQSSGTPVNDWSNPGAADMPDAAATGAQNRYGH